MGLLLLNDSNTEQIFNEYHRIEHAFHMVGLLFRWIFEPNRFFLSDFIITHLTPI